jgi:hypothetical protein
MQKSRLISQATAKDRQALVIVDRAGYCQVGKKWRFDDYSYLCKGL